ncbi:MAG: metallophosphoesterase [bacterium]|nr:metallophosphoesterase [bacterium]
MKGVKRLVALSILTVCSIFFGVNNSRAAGTWVNQAGYTNGVQNTAFVNQTKFYNTNKNRWENTEAFYLWQYIPPKPAGNYVLNLIGSVVVIPDIHTTYSPAYPYSVHGVVDWVNTMGNAYKVKCVFALGDITDNGDGASTGSRGYDTFITEMNNLSTVPWIPVRGNHDLIKGTTITNETTFWDKFFCKYPLRSPILSNWSKANASVATGMTRVYHNGYTFNFSNGGFDIALKWYDLYNVPKTQTWHFAYTDFCARRELGVGNADLFDWREDPRPNYQMTWGTLQWLANYELGRVRNTTLGKTTVILSHHPVLLWQALGGVYATFSDLETDTLIKRLNNNFSTGTNKLWNDFNYNYEPNINMWVSGHMHFPPWEIRPQTTDGIPMDFTQWVADNFSGAEGCAESSPGRVTLLAFYSWELFTTPQKGLISMENTKGTQVSMQSWKGNQFKPVNSILPSAQSGLNWDDYYKLEELPDLTSGKYKLRACGNTNTDCSFNNMQLVSVLHPDSTGIGTTTYGKIIHYAKKLVPISCVNSSGKNMLSIVKAQDNNYVSIPAGGWIEINFGKLKEEGYVGIYEAGESENLPQIIICNGDTVSAIFPREKPYLNFVEVGQLPSDSTLIVKIFAKGKTGLAKIDEITYFTSAPWQDIRVDYCELSKATYCNRKGQITDVTPKRSGSDGDRMSIFSNEYVDLEFSPPPARSDFSSGYTREFITVVTAGGKGTVSSSSASDDKGTGTVANVFKLYEPNPNPSRDITVIRYNVPEKAQVSLKLYDASGRMVRTLKDGICDAGDYKAEIDSKTLSLGVYFVKLNSGNYKETKKLTVLH